MKIRKKLLACGIFSAPISLIAAETTVAVSATGSMLKMMLGLVFVLAVMALVAWFLKRMMPSIGKQQSAVCIVGSVSVGSRERVVVLEIAGRWLVVGVAPGQVSAIADLDKSVQDSLNADGSSSEDTGAIAPQTLATSFGKLLKKSANKFAESSNAKQ